MPRRRSIDILYEIVDLASQAPIKKTNIMFRVALSYRSVMAYLSLLLRTGLIEKTQDGSYRTTPKGLEFRNAYHKLLVLMNGASIGEILSRGK